MAGFFSRKSKNGVETPAESAPAPSESQALYEPLATVAPRNDAPEAIAGIPDLYAVLGVDPRSSDDIIRYAYRRKAAKMHDARWRPGRAARQLAELNAAYEILGKPDRRADYDRQRARYSYYQQPGLPGGPTAPLPQSAISGGTARNARALPSRRLRIPTGLIQAIVVIGVVAAAMYGGYTLVNSANLIDLAAIRESATRIISMGRAQTSPIASPTAIPVLATPTPRQVIVPPVLPSPGTSLSASPTPPATRTVAESVRATARINNPAPARGTEVSVVMRLTRESAPLRNVPVFAVAHYKTVDERFPANEGTVATNDLGESTITFNIGDATAGFPVNVDLIATVDDEQVKAQTSFLPR
jgi:hypothetical protein